MHSDVLDLMRASCIYHSSQGCDCHIWQGKPLHFLEHACIVDRSVRGLLLLMWVLDKAVFMPGDPIFLNYYPVTFFIRSGKAVNSSSSRASRNMDNIFWIY